MMRSKLPFQKSCPAFTTAFCWAQLAPTPCHLSFSRSERRKRPPSPPPPPPQWPHKPNALFRNAGRLFGGLAEHQRNLIAAKKKTGPLEELGGAPVIQQNSDQWPFKYSVESRRPPEATPRGMAYLGGWALNSAGAPTLTPPYTLGFQVASLNPASYKNKLSRMNASMA